MILLGLLIGSTLAQSFTPSDVKGSSVIEYRFLDTTVADGAFLNGLPTGSAAYSPGLLNLTSTVQGTSTVTQLSMAGASVFTVVSAPDPVSGQPRAVTFNLYYGSSNLSPLCSETISPPSAGFHKRVTIRVKQSNSGGVGCQLLSGQCTTPAAFKQVSCDRDVQLVETVRNCNEVGARVVRRDARCAPVRIQRSSTSGLAIDANEAVFLSKLFNLADYVPSVSPAADTTFKRSQTYAIDGATLAAHADARAYEITIDASSATGAAFDTAFFKFVHAAHREQQNSFGSGASLDSSVFVAIDKSIASPRQVFHVETVQAGQRAPSGASDFYELPVGTYDLRIFGGLNNVGTVYGNQNITSNPNASKNPDVTTQITLAANKFYVIVIQTNSQPYLTVKARVQDVTPAAPTAAGTYINIYNEISSTQGASSFGIIASSDASCSVLTSSAITSGNTVPFSFTTAALTTHTFQLVTAGSTCKAIDAIGALDILADAPANGCVQRHIFITGRTYQFNDTTPFSTPTGCTSTCSVGGPVNVCTQRVSTKYGDITFTGEIRTDTNAGSLGSIVVEVPICSCEAPSLSACSLNHCDLAAKIDDVGRVVSGVSSAVGTSATATQKVCAAVGSSVKSFEKRYKEDHNDDDLANQVDNIKEDVKKLSDDVDNLSDDVNKVNDNVKDVKAKLGA